MHQKKKKSTFRCFRGRGAKSQGFQPTRDYSPFPGKAEAEEEAEGEDTERCEVSAVSLLLTKSSVRSPSLILQEQIDKAREGQRGGTLNDARDAPVATSTEQPVMALQARDDTEATLEQAAQRGALVTRDRLPRHSLSWPGGPLTTYVDKPSEPHAVVKDEISLEKAERNIAVGGVASVTENNRGLGIALAIETATGNDSAGEHKIHVDKCPEEIARKVPVGTVLGGRGTATGSNTAGGHKIHMETCPEEFGRMIRVGTVHGDSTALGGSIGCLARESIRAAATETEQTLDGVEPERFGICNEVRWKGFTGRLTVVLYFKIGRSSAELRL